MKDFPENIVSLEGLNSTTEDKPRTRLFRVWSEITTNVPECGAKEETIIMDWCVIDRPSPVIPYKQGIRNYRKDKYNSHMYAEWALDECFTEQEADALKEYLLRVHDTGCEMKEVDLPLEFNIMATSALPLDRCRGNYSLHEEKDYDLPFKVKGVYRHCPEEG